MSYTVYPINKGINQPIEFKGLKAQYIGWLGGGIVLLLVIFAVLYIAGVSIYIAVGVVLAGGWMLLLQIYRVSRKYGQYGMMKWWAKRSIPTTIKIRSRKIFYRLIK